MNEHLKKRLAQDLLVYTRTVGELRKTVIGLAKELIDQTPMPPVKESHIGYDLYMTNEEGTLVLWVDSMFGRDRIGPDHPTMSVRAMTDFINRVNQRDLAMTQANSVRKSLGRKQIHTALGWSKQLRTVARIMYGTIGQIESYLTTSGECVQLPPDMRKYASAETGLHLLFDSGLTDQPEVVSEINNPDLAMLFLVRVLVEDLL